MLGARGYSVVEEYYRPHLRVLLVEAGGFRLYSIDVYAVPGPGELRCREVLDAGAGARLCYSILKGGCEAVVVEVPGEGRREVVSLRLAVPVESDPAGGSPSRAAEYCLRALDGALARGQRLLP